MIEIKYKNNEDEFCNFAMYRAIKSDNYKKAVKRKTYMISSMLLIAGIVYFFVSRNMNTISKNVGMGFGIAFIAASIINLFIFNKFINRSVKKSILKNLRDNKDILGKSVKVKFDGKNISVSRGKERYTVVKEEILEIINLNNTICIAIKNNAGIVIPYSAFKNEEEKDKFYDSIMKLI